MNVQSDNILIKQFTRHAHAIQLVKEPFFKLNFAYIRCAQIALNQLEYSPTSQPAWLGLRRGNRKLGRRGAGMAKIRARKTACRARPFTCEREKTPRIGQYFRYLSIKQASCPCLHAAASVSQSARARLYPQLPYIIFRHLSGLLDLTCTFVLAYSNIHSLFMLC